MGKSLRRGFSKKKNRKSSCKASCEASGQKSGLKIKRKNTNLILLLDEEKMKVTKLNGGNSKLTHFQINLSLSASTEKLEQKFGQMSPLLTGQNDIKTTKIVVINNNGERSNNKTIGERSNNKTIGERSNINNNGERSNINNNGERSNINNNGERSIRLSSEIRKNLATFFKNQKQIASCKMFRCYAFAVFLTAGQFPFCDMINGECKHETDRNNKGILIDDLMDKHIAKNFTKEKVTKKFRQGDIVAFNNPHSGFQHFAIDLGHATSTSTGKKKKDRLCLSKLGMYSKLYLTTHEELHRMYMTDGKMWRLIPNF
jgi:hypothetical protein